MINTTASVLSLARTIRQGVDPAQEFARVNAASLCLLIDTLLELGEPTQHAKIADSANRMIVGRVAEFANGKR